MKQTLTLLKVLLKDGLNIFKIKSNNKKSKVKKILFPLILFTLSPLSIPAFIISPIVNKYAKKYTHISSMIILEILP